MDYVGRQFNLGKTDCYTLVRDYYLREFEIELPNVARPNDFWDHGLDLYSKHYAKAGFTLLDVMPHEWKRGDVVLMAIMSSIPNHAAVIVEPGKILHHLYGRLSMIEPYRGIWRNTTTGVYRHKAVVLPEEGQDEVDIREVLSPRQRRILNEISSG